MSALTDYTTNVSGVFVKIVQDNTVGKILEKGSAVRPAARYNRKGEDAMYLSMSEESARVALSKYRGKEVQSWFLLQFELEACNLYDLRKPANSSLAALSLSDWTEEYSCGRQPKSWSVSDSIRGKTGVGLIDPSRKNPEYWHVVLFRWNEPGAPTIRLWDAPRAITF